MSTLKKFLKGYWHVYFYNNEDSTSISNIARALIVIKDLKNMTLTNRASGVSIDYNGGLDVQQPDIDGILYLKFKPLRQDKVANLQVALHINNDSFSMCIGQYTNIGINRNLIRGSIIFEKIPEAADETKIPQPKAFYIDNDGDYVNIDNSSKKEILDKDFATFFRDRNLNFTRLPSKIFDKSFFSKWIARQEQRRIDSEFNSYKEKPRKLFISHPVGSLKDTHDDLATQLKETSKAIQNSLEDQNRRGFKFIKVFLADDLNDPLEEQGIIPSDNLHMYFRYVRKKYDDCSHHLVIWPKH